MRWQTISLLFPWQEKHKILNKFVCIGTQWCPKDGTVRLDWVLKKKTSHKNCFTSRKRVLSPHNVILDEFQSKHWQTYRLETQKPQLRTLAKTSSCGSFHQRNWVFSSKILVYMPIGPYLSNSLYKSFLTMAFATRSPMQWRPSNRKLAVCLTGNEINRAYSNMNIDCWTREFMLFCDN